MTAANCVSHCRSPLKPVSCSYPTGFCVVLDYNDIFANSSDRVSAFLRHGTSHELFTASSWANRMLARAGDCAFAPGSRGRPLAPYRQRRLMLGLMQKFANAAHGADRRPAAAGVPRVPRANTEQRCRLRYQSTRRQAPHRASIKGLAAVQAFRLCLVLAFMARITHLPHAFRTTPW